MPAAIFVIPYADLMFAVIRRTRAGKPVMAADRQHLHHRVLNIGHSYRQSVLIMYLWAALFSVTVVSLSVVRTRLVVFVVATVVAVLTLLPVTMPRLRPWRLLRGPVPAAHRGTVPASHRGTAPAAARRGTRRGTPQPAGPVLNGASSSGAAPIQHAPFRNDQLLNGQFPYAQLQGDRFAADQLPHDQFPGGQLPRAGRLPGVDPVAPFAPAYPVDPLGPGPAPAPAPAQAPAPRRPSPAPAARPGPGRRPGREPRPARSSPAPRRAALVTPGRGVGDTTAADPRRTVG